MPQTLNGEILLKFGYETLDMNKTNDKKCKISHVHAISYRSHPDLRPPLNSHFLQVMYKRAMVF